MAYGLTVVTTGGVLQIDSDSGDLYSAIRRSGTASTFQKYGAEAIFIKFPTPTSGTRKRYFLHTVTGTNELGTFAVRELGNTTNITVDYYITGPQGIFIPEGTSTTSRSIGTGSKSFTTNSGLGYSFGDSLIIFPNAIDFMAGTVTSYNNSTGALTVNVTSTEGTGIYNSWGIKEIPVVQDYGLKIINSNGEPTLDTRRFLFNENFEPLDYYAVDSLGGYGTTYPAFSSDCRICDLTDYVNFNWSRQDGSDFRGVDVANAYTASGGNDTGVYYLDQSLFSGNFYNYFNNFTEVVTGGAFSS